MSDLQWWFGWISTLQVFVLLLVLIHRGHHRLLPFFTVYVGGSALSTTIVGVWYTWDTWMVHQVTVATLRFVFALELAYSIFGAFPAAAMTARRVTFAVLIVTAVTLMSVVDGEVTYTRFNAELVPRLATGAVWIFTALAALVLWYRLPLAELQRAILLGYAPFLLIFTVAMNLLASIGWQVRDWVGYVSTISFFVLIHYWCHVAWRSAPAVAVRPGGAVPSLAHASSGSRRVAQP